jgi:hypothetical protein
VNTPEDIEAEIWRHALEMAEPGGLGRLIETETVIQALILAAGRLAEHTGMPPALFCGHVVEAIRRLRPSGRRTHREPESRSGGPEGP